MPEIDIHEYKEKDVSDALAIISFPTVGVISNIVANFLIANLELELIAAFVSDEFYPAAIIHEGMPIPPVRDFISSAMSSLAFRRASLVAATRRSFNISASPDFNTSGSMVMLLTCMAPLACTVTMPPTVDASTVLVAASS